MFKHEVLLFSMKVDTHKRNALVYFGKWYGLS